MRARCPNQVTSCVQPPDAVTGERSAGEFFRGEQLGEGVGAGRLIIAPK